MAGEIVVIWNPSAGSPRKRAAVRSQLEQDPRVAILETRTREEAIKTVRRAWRAGAEFVISAGGDGTVNAVVQALADAPRETRLGVLPLGTGNDLCRTLAVPLDPIAALEAIAAGPTRRLDLARVDTGAEARYFINLATGGNAPRISQFLTPEMKARWGPMCYLRGAVSVLSDLQVFDINVKTDGPAAGRYPALNVVLGNGRTAGGGLYAAPHADPQDGLLDLIIVLDGTPVEIASASTSFLLSDYLTSDLVVYDRVSHVEIHADRPLPLSVDGEVIEADRFSFEVVPAAIDVVVGPDFDAPRAGDHLP